MSSKKMIHSASIHKLKKTNKMKQKVIVLGIFLSLIKVDFAFGQSPTIQSDEYKILTQFEQINGSKDVNGAKEFMALASYNDHYAILMENVVINDYSTKVQYYDKEETSMVLQFLYQKKQGNTSVSYWDKILLKPCDIQPKSNTKGFLMAFELSNEYAFDIKGKTLSSITLIEESGNSKLNTPHGPSTYTEGFFIRNESKIISKQGTFIDLENYKANKIPLYSLLLQKKQDIIKHMGAPNNKSISEHPFAEYRNDSVYNYENNIGYYEISFKGDISYYITFLPKIKIAGTDSYFLKKYLNDKYPFDIENKFPQDYTVKQGSSSSGDSYENSLMYYFKDDIVHKIALISKGRFVEKAEVYVYKDENLLTSTKSQKELFKEKIDETVFSTKEVCKENGWDYNQSMFNKIRKQFPEIVQNENWSFACTDKTCSGNLQLIINWISKNGSSSMKVFPIENGTSCISSQLAYYLTNSLSSSNRPKIYGEYVNCSDTLYGKIIESNISVFKSASSLKFNNPTIDKNIKDYVLNNIQKLKLNEDCVFELRILDLEFESTVYKIGLIKISQKELNKLELAKMRKDYIY
jgi:hypothetical protein